MVITPEVCIVYGGHAYCTSTMQDTLHAMAHSFVDHIKITNTNHVSASSLLRQIAIFYFTSLVQISWKAFEGEYYSIGISDMFWWSDRTRTWPYTRSKHFVWRSRSLRILLPGHFQKCPRLPYIHKCDGESSRGSRSSQSKQHNSRREGEYLPGTLDLLRAPALVGE